jgi:hypothetical protein
MKLKIITLLVLTLASPLRADPASELKRFESEAEAALKPVRTAYMTRLNAAMATATRNGQLDEALLCRAALDKVKSPLPAGSLLAPKLPISGAKWQWEKGEIIFAQDGIVHSGDGDWEKRGLVTTWRHIGNGAVVLEITKGRNDQLIALLQFDAAWTSYDGFSFDGKKIAKRVPVK